MIIDIRTGSRTEMVDITAKVQEVLDASGVSEGICVVYVPHTTAAVAINESADPAVSEDIVMVLNRVVPWKEAYRHLEGNSPAHVKATLVGASETIPVAGGRLALGTWQGIFFCEFDGPRHRKVRVHTLAAATE